MFSSASCNLLLLLLSTHDSRPFQSLDFARCGSRPSFFRPGNERPTTLLFEDETMAASVMNPLNDAHTFPLRRLSTGGLDIDKGASILSGRSVDRS